MAAPTANPPPADQESVIRAAVLESYYNHAMLYLDGLSVPADPVIAVSKFKKAADKGHLPSMHKLADLYATGLGTNVRNMEQSVLLYSSAARQGYIPSVARVADCYRYGIHLQKDVYKAVQMYSTAVKAGSLPAMVGLADCFRDGAGVEKNINRAIQLYDNAAKRKFAPAHYRLGECYLTGVGLGKDFKKAYIWFQSAEANNDKRAYYQLARCCARGIGTQRNEKQAFEYLLQAADGAGDKQAMYAVAMIYFEGKVVTKNYDKAVEYFQKAAALDHSKANIALADCYMHGYGVEKDAKRAYHYYLEAEKANEIDGVLGQAECCLDANGVERDVSKGLYLLKRAIENNRSTVAALLLARRYFHGVGVEQNVQEAMVFFQKAAALGSPEAHLHLARLYEKSMQERDKATAVEHYKVATNLGSVEAGVQLALCLLHGSGIKQNAPEAVRMLQELSRSDNSDACMLLADCYFFARGCEKDCAKGVQLLHKLADKRHTVATRRLARCYYLGIGVQQDYTRAAMFFEKAMNQGDIIATVSLGTCCRLGHGIPKNLTRAFYLYKSAADAGNQIALINVALCYERGIGVKYSFKQAALLYEKAIMNGASIAVGSLTSCYEKVENDMDIGKREVTYLGRLLDKKGGRRRIYRLAYLYLKGRGVVEDPAKAYELIQGVMREERTCYALRFSAYCLLHGKGAPQNPREAVNLLYEAIQKGSRRAKVMLAECLMAGLAGEKDEAKGLSLIEEACQEGSVDAALVLGDRMYQGYIQCGNGKYCSIERNYEEAVQLYKRAGERAEPFYRLACCYMRGTGVEKCTSRSLDFLTRSASMGYPYAQLQMAQYCTSGVHMMSKNYGKALKLYEGAVHRVHRRARGRAMHRFASFLSNHGAETDTYHAPEKVDQRVKSLLDEAARGNTIEAVNDLGVITERQKHKVGEDEEDADVTSTQKAFELFRRAAETLPRAQANIGICFEMGIGTCRDMTQARQYYEKAIEKKDTVAMNNLALCLVEDKEYEKAIGYFKEAMAKGESSAYVNMGWLLERGEGVEKNADEALEMYKEAAKLDNAEGHINVASCYEKEIGAKYDGEMAQLHYTKAMSLGSAEAKERLKMYIKEIRLE